ncbi:MAG TPA: outer membrane beta-barrel domain-containing protein, partial [Gammaproteobacteria bacterium]|nr:outer membrane beta-barrel domain-containing protein [Gammaproteobacteria bacterium]
MGSRIRIFLLKAAGLVIAVCLLQGCSLLQREEPEYSGHEPVITPDLERRTITEADIDSEDFEVGVFVGIMSVEDFGSNVVYG